MSINNFKRVTFAREDLKRRYALPQYCIEITVVPIEAFRKMLTNSFPKLKEHFWTIP
jgi:hypothetical protein